MVVLLLSVSVPLALSFFKPIALFRRWRVLSVSLGMIVLIFGAWDVFATARGHWHFNPAGDLPLRLINLPLEEVLFFVIIPFCCIFTWEVIKYFQARL